MPTDAALDVKLLARICGQFGNDNAHVRAIAAGRALAMLGMHACQWADVIRPHRDGLLEALAPMQQADDHGRARIAADAHAIVLRTDGTWERAMQNARAPTPGSERKGGPGGIDLDGLMEIITASINYPAFHKTIDALMRMHGLRDVAEGMRAQARTTPEPDARPQPEPRPTKVSGANVPVVVVGTVRITCDSLEPTLRRKLTILVHDPASGITYGPVEARDPKSVRRLLDGAGSVMRVTTRQGRSSWDPREVVRVT